jgi:hypothetical protein
MTTAPYDVTRLMPPGQYSRMSRTHHAIPKSSRLIRAALASLSFQGTRTHGVVQRGIGVRDNVDCEIRRSADLQPKMVCFSNVTECEPIITLRKSEGCSRWCRKFVTDRPDRLS